MAYCTSADLIKRRRLVTGIAQKTTTELPDDDILTECISRADTDIDRVLEEVFDVPFLIVPTLIKFISIDLSIAYIYEYQSDKIPALIEQWRNNALRLLEDLYLGKITLAGVSRLSTSRVYTNLDSDDLVFNNDLWDTYN